MSNVSVGDGPLGVWRERQREYEEKSAGLGEVTRTLLDANQVEAQAKLELDRVMADSKSLDGEVLAAKAAWQAARSVSGKLTALKNSLDPQVANLRTQLDSAKTAFINA